MRIIVWGINYAPEVTGIAPYNVMLCEFLHGRGHEVAMLTSFSYYPAWQKSKEDQGRLFRTDRVNGVPVYRCWQYVPRHLTAVKRMLHEATFVSTSFVRLLAMSKPHVLVVISPPLILGVAATVFKALRDVPFVFHVQDLQPDAAVGLGMLKPGWLTQILYKLEETAYRAAEKVSGITRGMVSAFNRKGVLPEKALYTPNSVSLMDAHPAPSPGMFRIRQGLCADHFVAIYSGNLGVKQGLAVLLDAALLVDDPRIRVVICGDGAERQALADQITRLRVQNVGLLPLQDAASYKEMLDDADLCLITQQAGSGRFFFPSKLLTTLANGKPVLVVADADSELTEAVAEGQFGYRVGPEDPQAIASGLCAAAENRELLREMGERGRQYVKRFERTRVLGEFEKVLLQVAAEARK